ncbi:formyltransferase family protein [Dactylococcopsis salina]|uniref:phosphoribosylglycinamide formyltransferase 1 n=1 Tax=Dactylococcopsis salina (strain PCC 8305) TaxID=13035 RepID=K9YWY6_DACS8|nr:formyltransferase family protein [Dactylococcopsis salina]AFZ50830.1 methionyl-tRNA formyltransferase [Dactylococcopsis salina PCC 8305]
MKVLLLGPERSEIIGALDKSGDEVEIIEKKLSVNDPIIQEVDFLISYGYRHILRKDILSKFQNKAINIHISLLPWNRGADPNLWSFLENTPKGVTIHYLDEGIDTGNILVQTETEFTNEDTLRTSYEKLNELAIELFQSSWLKIREGKIPSQPQPGGGSLHRLQDRERYKHLLTNGWDTPVINLIGKALSN